MRRIDTPFGMVEIRDERRDGTVYTIGGEDYEAHDGLQRIHRLNGLEISDPLVMAAVRSAVANYDHLFYLACRRSATWTPNEYDSVADARAQQQQAEARAVWG